MHDASSPEAWFALLPPAHWRWRCLRRARQGAIRRADQDRLLDGADRAAVAERQAGAARPADLGGRGQRQGRSARASGQAHLLRRSEPVGAGAGHLHQAARRRQGRPRARPLRHGARGGRHAGGHAEEQDDDHPVRPRRELRVQVRQVLRHDPVRARSEAVVHDRLLRDRGGAESEAADRGVHRRRPGVLEERLRRRQGQRQEGRPAHGL